MELSEKELKDLENLLIKDNHQKKEKENQKLIKGKENESNSNIKKIKLFSSLPKLKKNKVKIEPEFESQKLSINLPITITSTNNNSSRITKNQNILLNESNNKGNQVNFEFKIFSKKERSQRVKKILGQIKRKTNEDYPQSSNTNLNLYRELSPGPGDYNINQNDISLSHNLRYKNLYNNNTKKHKNVEKYYERKVGPGTYNITDNYNYISYAQNPKVYISSLKRPPIFNEIEINKNVGPGTYDIESSFGKNYKKKLKNHSINLENKKAKFKKWLINELNVNNNTNFFDIKSNKKISYCQKNELSSINSENFDYNIFNEKNKGYDNIDLKNGKFNSIQNYKKNSPKRHFFSKSKKKCITNNNLEYKKDLLPFIKKHIINNE